MPKLKVVSSMASDVGEELSSGAMEPHQSLRDYCQAEQVSRPIQAGLVVYVRQQHCDPWGHYPLAQWRAWHAALLTQPVF